ncbi:MAG TPA: 4Fe-4S dicluster domain-containing protein [Steroidobacteraceae bacterium]
MPHIVTDRCQRCRFTECVTVCPVACFHGDEQMLYIDNATCIDCGNCVPACPVHAIFDQFELPQDQYSWIEINAQRAAVLPVVADKQTPLAGAETRKADLGF